MSVDISAGGASDADADVEAVARFSGFDDFFERAARVVATTLVLACNDNDLAETALQAAMVACVRRWRNLEAHPNPIGWAVNAGLREAGELIRDRPPAATDEATGGYHRGLELGPAIEALPLAQRSALVTTYHLGWSDEFTAAGFETEVETISSHRTRALGFLAHHSRQPVAEIESGVRAYLIARVREPGPSLPAYRDIVRRGWWRTIRNRVAGALVVAAVIGIGAALIDAARTEPAADRPVAVAGPSVSSDWLGPVSDGTGGFVALNRSGASRFVRSPDGSEWFEDAVWNSRAVDLRTWVTGFVRSHDLYLASIEVRPDIDRTMSPYIATSSDLFDWEVQQLEIDEPETIDGLRNRFEVAAMAASHDKVLVVIRLNRDVDHRSLGIIPQDVCVESTTPTAFHLHLCDGSSLRIDRAERSSGGVRFFLSDSGGPFVEVDGPDGVSARHVVGFDGGFVAVDSTSGAVSTSIDGTQWQPTVAADESRFVLIEGSSGRDALVIRPDASGWTSTVLPDDGSDPATLPLGLDPATVWTRPEVSSGPSGWAMFVTTARPWERTGATPGWAVDTGEWVVSRLPDAVVITAESADGSTTHRFVESGDQVRLDGETIELTLPDVSAEEAQPESVRIRVTADQIEQSRRVDGSGDTATAQVLYTPDGLDWRVLWQSTADNWFGKVSVGDDEVLVSGASLTGSPFTVPLDG